MQSTDYTLDQALIGGTEHITNKQEKSVYESAVIGEIKEIQKL